jgi:hypothetical protein
MFLYVFLQDTRRAQGARNHFMQAVSLLTHPSGVILAVSCGVQAMSNPTLKFAPFGRWDAPSARPLAAR